MLSQQDVVRAAAAALLTLTLLASAAPLSIVGGPASRYTAGPPSGYGFVINGTGFGTKSAAGPFFWQPFSTDDGQSDLQEIGYADQDAFSANPFSSTLEVDTSAGRAAGLGALRLTMNFTSGERSYFPHVAVDFSNTGAGSLDSERLYFAKWVRIERTSGTNTGIVQVKGPRAGYATSTSVDYYISPPRYTPSLYVDGAGAYLYLYQEAVDSTGSGDGAAEHFNFDDPPWSEGGWNFIEGVMTLNTPGVADGLQQFWINGFDMLPGFPEWENTDQIRVREVVDSGKRFTFIFLSPGIDLASMNGAAAYDVRFAEHYVDTSLQRVVLTDNATYASSTKFAVQVCDTWSNTQITGTLRATGFTAGPAYLHAFDADGNEVGSATEVAVQ
jgi:hypothetical protein